MLRLLLQHRVAALGQQPIRHQVQMPARRAGIHREAAGAAHLGAQPAETVFIDARFHLLFGGEDYAAFSRSDSGMILPCIRISSTIQSYPQKPFDFLRNPMG